MNQKIKKTKNNHTQKKKNNVFTFPLHLSIPLISFVISNLYFGIYKFFSNKKKSKNKKKLKKKLKLFSQKTLKPHTNKKKVSS